MPKRKWEKLKNDMDIEKERRQRKKRIEDRDVEKTTTTVEVYTVEEFEKAVLHGGLVDFDRLEYVIANVCVDPFGQFAEDNQVVQIRVITES